MNETLCCQLLCSALRLCDSPWQFSPGWLRFNYYYQSLQMTIITHHFFSDSIPLIQPIQMKLVPRHDPSICAPIPLLKQANNVTFSTRHKILPLLLPLLLLTCPYCKKNCTFSSSSQAYLYTICSIPWKIVDLAECTVQSGSQNLQSLMTQNVLK